METTSDRCYELFRVIRGARRMIPRPPERQPRRGRLSSGKGPYREGVVTAVTGSLLRVRWQSGQNTTVVPAPETLSVLGSSGGSVPESRGSERATPLKTPKRAATSSVSSKKAEPVPRKAAAEGSGAKVAKAPGGAGKKTGVKKTGVKKAVTKKGVTETRSGRRSSR